MQLDTARNTLQAGDNELSEERKLRARAEAAAESAAAAVEVATAAENESVRSGDKHGEQVKHLEHELTDAKITITMLRAARKETVEKAKDIVRENGVKVRSIFQ